MAASIKVTLELDDRGYLTGIKAAGAETKKVAQESEAAANAAGNMFSKIAGGAEMAVGKLKALAAAYIGLQAIHSALQLGDELSDLSGATDISIQKILQLQGALAAAGGNAEDAGRMISTLMNSLDAAAQGSADAQDKLFRLGFSLKDITNLTPEQSLQKTIDALGAMKNPIERNALAFDLLGRSARNINWDEVASKTKGAADKYDEAAAAAQKAGETFDKLAAQAKELKIALMIAVEPLTMIYDYLSKLTGGSLVLDTFKAVFQTVAILAANIGFVIKTIVDDIAGLFRAANQAVRGNFEAAGNILKQRSEEAQTLRDELDQLEKKILGMNAGAGRGLVNPAVVQPNTGATGEKPAAPLGRANEIAAIQNLADAFARANEKQREKITNDYALIGSSDEYKKMVEETTRIQQASGDEILKLRDKQNQLNAAQKRAGVGKAIEDTIKKIEAERDVAIQAATKIIMAGEDRIRVNKQLQLSYDQMVAAGMAANEIILGGTQKIKDAENARILETLNPLQKQLKQIAIEEEKVAKEQMKAFAARQEFASAEDGMNPEQAQLFAQGLENIINAQERVTKQRQEQAAAIYNEQHTFEYGWDKALKSYVTNWTDASLLAQRAFQSFTGNMESAIDKFVETGKFSFGDFAASVIKNLIKIQLQAQATQLLMSLTSGGGVMGFLGSLFKANGGPVSPNEPYIVGERGMELFIPKSAGTIVPNNKLGQGGGATAPVYITNNISAIDSKSVAQLFAENRTILFGNVEQARREMPMRTR